MIVSVSPSTQVEPTVVARCHLHGALDPLTQPSAEGIGAAGTSTMTATTVRSAVVGRTACSAAHDLLVQREARRLCGSCSAAAPVNGYSLRTKLHLHFTPTGQEFIPALGNGGGMTATAQRATLMGTMGFPPDTTCAVPHAVRPGHRSVPARLTSAVLCFAPDFEDN